MFPSIATVCLSGALPEKLDAIARAGFEGVELFENDLTAFDGSAREVGELIRERGLKLVTLQPFRDFEGLEGDDRRRAFDRAERKFDLMEELGTDLLMACSSVHPRALPGIARAADDFHELGERAAKRGLRVAFEALAWGRHIHDYRDSWEVVRRADHSAVGLVLDTFHIFSRGTELGTLAGIPGDRIFLVQTADAPRLSMDHLSWSRHYRCFPGQGELQMRDFMTALAETRYDGPLSHEIFNDVFRTGRSRQTARDGLHSYKLLKTMTGTTDVPAEQPIEAVEFIEIVTTDDKIDGLRDTCRALGLAPLGQHPTKTAERWGVEGVNLVLNTERDFAERFHGGRQTAAGAFGLRVGNSYNTIQRARELGYPLIEAADDSTSHGMTALDSTEGSLAYLLDAPLASRVWDTEFSVDRAAPQAGLLKAVDHLSLSLSYHDYLSLLLQYRGLFQLETTASFDVADPRGLIQSQVLHSAGGDFRLALNASASPDTTSNKFVRRHGGSGVQHIALASSDIIASAERLQAANVPVLEIPDNYYRDLQARFDLDDASLADLQRLNILYDEDDAGRFWQLYTQPIHDTFFFEIVQRDGYQGLGAPNAFVRVAAQRRAERATMTEEL
ncbi:hypothetical protein BGP77_15260 [Saccharospirillum sp. MSK14-1]|uniref:bifunctional sugar phosphate isomerase/epimerase/4-hydroxyphenylpyruvate dioxygenase family protein n=1 Tax=Saccharospirillum sp. MSK14-1 TaxID=1897632 RepID=UPI000D338388|nr:sugar phosphate isomerase/epimerase and 4-hydroxyphenylpyruvate domain-containing protein [Saccharospirillum sp. MSK14-1]PTY37831.1 hypothetical protein BGP77_15260 [Saccharospirillum sp. MSK14-1]